MVILLQQENELGEVRIFQDTNSKSSEIHQPAISL